MKRSTAKLVLCVALFAGVVHATFDLTDFNIEAVGDVPAKFAMVSHRLIEVNMAQGKVNPPLGARFIAILDICMYDALSYFHPKWLPLIARDLCDKPASKDATNGEVALAHSAYRCIREMWGNGIFDTTSAFAKLEDLMADLGLSPADPPFDCSSPASIGNQAAWDVLAYFEKDRANNDGDIRSSEGGPYSDSTNSDPVNDASNVPNKINCAKLRNINHWVPLRVPSHGWNQPDQGVSSVQSFAGVGSVLWKPITLSHAAEFRPKSPPQKGTNTQGEWIGQYNEVQDIYAALGDLQKVIGEYWAERKEIVMGGPMGRLQEWSCILAHVRNYNIFQSVKLMLLQGVAQYDGVIGAWEAKRFYDHPRPISVIQCRNKGKTIKSWLGPYKGVGEIDGSDWFPYQAWNFNTPPFPGYVSGHATMGGATAEIFRLFSGGDDTLDWQFVFREGTSKLESKITSGAGHVPGVTDVANTGPESVGYVPATDITLHWATFSEAGRQCGEARVFGGVHIRADFENGNLLGRRVAKKVFKALTCAFNGQKSCAPKLKI